MPSERYNFYFNTELQFWSPKKEPPKFKRFVGVELEIAGTKPDGSDPEVEMKEWSERKLDYAWVLRKDRFSHPDMVRLGETVKKWHGSIAFDGSLPHGSGFEIRTAPAMGPDFAKQIREICAALSNVHAYVNEKCGTHIHVDMRDFTFADIRKLMYLYAKYEGAWIQTLPTLRATNKYCKPIGPQLADGLDGMVPEKPHFTASIQGKMDYSNRYKALNFAAFQRHKTVEVRMHEGTLDPEALTHWARCWSIFVQKAKDLQQDEIQKLKSGLKELTKLLDTISAEYLVKRTQQFASEWSDLKKKNVGLQWVS